MLVLEVLVGLYRTIQYNTNPRLCLKSNAEEAEVEQFYEDFQDLLELTTKKDILFITGDWNAKVRNQEIPWSWGTKLSRAKANRVLPREHTGHSKHPLPTT